MGACTPRIIRLCTAGGGVQTCFCLFPPVLFSKLVEYLVHNSSETLDDAVRAERSGDTGVFVGAYCCTTGGRTSML